jgi:hypothetical protein
VSSAGRFNPRLTRRTGIKLAFSGLCANCVGTSKPTAPPQVRDLIGRIPSRPSNALTGSQFAESILDTVPEAREQAILHQLLEGNMPDFLRSLTGVELSSEFSATIFVMPEYLAIGSDSDFLRIPMNLHTAMAVADRFGFLLPTRKIVDAIYNHSSCRFSPQSLPPGPQMTSTEYYRTHNVIINAQSRTREFPSGALVAGHKKDVVLTNRLIQNPGRIAIYGWHRSPGMPIQPLSTVHGATYADYSHGIRLVARTALIEGRRRLLEEILLDPALAGALSDEGPIRVESIPGGLGYLF